MKLRLLKSHNWENLVKAQICLTWLFIIWKFLTKLKDFSCLCLAYNVETAYTLLPVMFITIS